MSDLDDFIKTVGTIGFAYIGRDGQNHPRFQHTNGEQYSVALTPSDYRSRRNALATMERIAGQRVARQRSGKYKFKPPTTLSVTKSEREQRACRNVEDMVATAEKLRKRFTYLTTEPTVAAIEEARSILRRYNDLRLVLATKHRIIPDINGVQS